ncbi:MAG: hypothetical protein IJI24_09445 [Lachnospiraceae bacterium]|nr:hypothetical protein [Lachnospiraceae bacterium]
MKYIKRAGALLSAIFLLSLYGITFYLGVTGNEKTTDLLMASILCTVLIPVVLYAMIRVAKASAPTLPTDDDGKDAETEDSGTP